MKDPSSGGDGQGSHPVDDLRAARPPACERVLSYGTQHPSTCTTSLRSIHANEGDGQGGHPVHRKVAAVAQDTQEALMLSNEPLEDLKRLERHARQVDGIVSAQWQW